MTVRQGGDLRIPWQGPGVDLWVAHRVQRALQVGRLLKQASGEKAGLIRVPLGYSWPGYYCP